MAIIDSYYSSLFLIWLISTILVYIFTTKFLRSSPKMSFHHHHPPSPPSLPLIGHMHLLSKNAPKSLQALASRYGPLMRISVGSSTSLVVSNAVVATEVLKTHDLNFANRPGLGASDYLLYKDSSFFMAEYGQYWRFLKKICMTQVLSATQINLSVDIRKQEVLKLLEVVLKCSYQKEACNLGEEMMKMSNNIICRSMMSTVCTESADQSQMIREFVNEITEISAKIRLGEVLGPLKKLDLFGYGRRLRSLLVKYDKLVEGILQEHEMDNNSTSEGKKDMMDIMLHISKDETAEVKLTRDDIKSFSLELFLAGTGTTGSTLQWILAELINHQEAFKKLRHEIMAVVGTNRLVEESDIPNLPYLQAIVKESLRLHPAAPLILRKSIADCKINGYDVLANSRMMINVHAIMRDPDSWCNPTEFVPDRFLWSDKTKNWSDHESNGQSFLNYLPFGSGRRACPGATFATTVLHVTVATLVQCFDFETKDGLKVDMKLSPNTTANMALSLVCYPVVRINPLKLLNVDK